MAPVETKQGGSFRQGQRLGQGLQPGCSDPGWRYSRVPPFEAAAGSSAQFGAAHRPAEPEALTREHTSTTSSACNSQAALLRQPYSVSRGEGPSTNGNRLSWLGPAALLLGALFVQNAGLYSATGHYVRWMDELNKVALQAEESGDYTEAFSLDDPLAAWLSKLRLAEALQIPYLSETWIDAAIAFLAVVWLCWVVRMQDVRLWTRSLLCGSALAVAKGIVAWMFILPDSAGWYGCQQRLGQDGLAYFREAATDTGPAGFLQALGDILLLEMRALWVLEHSGRRRVCADTVLSGEASFCIVLAAGLYDVVRTATSGFEASRRLGLRALTFVVLGLALAAGLLRSLLTPGHYTLDVLLAVVLAHLAYGSPAVALCTSSWMSLAAPGDVHDPSNGEADGNLSRAFATMTAMSAEPIDRPFLRDLGECSLPPFAGFVCGGGDTCYLRADPGEAGIVPWTQESEKRQQQHLSEFREVLAREARRRQQAEGDIAKEHEQVREHSREVEERNEQRLKAELDRLEAEEEGQLHRAQKELEAVRTAAAKLQEKATGEAKRYSRTESEYKVKISQLVGSQKKLRKTAEEARIEMIGHEQRSFEYERQQEVLHEYLFRNAEPKIETTKEEPCAVLGLAETR